MKYVKAGPFYFYTDGLEPDFQCSGCGFLYWKLSMNYSELCPGLTPPVCVMCGEDVKSAQKGNYVPIEINDLPEPPPKIYFPY